MGTDFVCKQGELVIVDEADTFMLNNPEKFAALIQECCCICFTATPDNCDPNGVEAKVTATLKFKKLHYMIDEE